MGLTSLYKHPLTLYCIIATRLISPGKTPRSIHITLSLCDASAAKIIKKKKKNKRRRIGFET